MKKVLVLGGYGIFGQRISTGLAKRGIFTIIAGRRVEEANKLAQAILQKYPQAKIQTIALDVEKDLSNELMQLKPALVINTCGPFQTKDYRVAISCIKSKIHYIDLADGRNFVKGITTLDQSAKEAGVLVISGASTVPGLTSAVLDHFREKLKQIDRLVYGIAPGQKAPRGVATTQSILSYLGKPIKPAPGENKIRYGWQDLYRQTYPIIGKRWMANCEIPDIDLIPEYYQIKHIHFAAGMESSLLHFGIWVLSWLIRLGLPLNLIKHGDLLLKMSHWFDRFGSADGGMHLLVQGVDYHNQKKAYEWFIIAKNGDGPEIPCIPAIVLAKKILSLQEKRSGAMPCIGLISLDEYLSHLTEFQVEVYENQIVEPSCQIKSKF